MLLKQLHQQRDAILNACHQFGANNIRVFGSVARGEETADSDIDFLVDLPIGYDMFTQRLALQDRLQEITGRSLDLIPEHELNIHMRHTITEEAVQL